MGSCGKESKIVKFATGNMGWVVVHEANVKTEKIEDVFRILNIKTKEKSWGQSITEIGCITRINNVNQVSVQIMESLSEHQLNALVDVLH